MGWGGVIGGEKTYLNCSLDSLVKLVELLNIFFNSITIENDIGRKLFPGNSLKFSGFYFVILFLIAVSKFLP